MDLALILDIALGVVLGTLILWMLGFVAGIIGSAASKLVEAGFLPLIGWIAFVAAVIGGMGLLAGLR